MKAGEVVQEGPPIDIYRKPKNKYVADLGSICNYFNKDSDKVHNNIESTLSCVRAIDLLLCNSTDNDFSGKIIESFYLGPNFEYTLSLKNGRNIIFYSEEILEIGKAVFLKIREGCIIYF